MKHYVIIDDQTETGKSVLTVLHNLSQTNGAVSFSSIGEIEEELDHEFTMKIQAGLKSGNASRKEIMEILEQ